ncbi:MAG TPA: IS1634 family transposase [Nocardioidaceae bacterium]|nr:IS1634 family transposase [Nocardioidaceae bacterium]
MPSIVGKRRGKQTYYYLVESARVDGKPRIVSQEYLGTAEEVMARLQGTDSGLPDRTQHKRFGDVAAVWGLCQQLGVADIVDEVVGDRRSDVAVSVGTYLTLATVNRIVDPCSKRAFAEWWDTTAGPRFVRPRLPAGATDHRRFWDAMDTLTEEQLAEIERRITLTAIERFDLDLSGLVLDMTNFATFIDTANDRAPIAKRGKAKQKRHDLRLVGLALVVTHDGAVPVVSHPYPGNRHDSTQFTGLLDEIVGRWAALGGDPTELTITYDSGQNSADNHTHIEALGLGYVTSLPPSDHPNLLAIPASSFGEVDPDRYPGVTAHDTVVDALGVTRRAVITHSESFHQRQARGFEQTLTKARRQLSELQARLARGRTRKSAAAVQTEIDKILAPRWLNRVITTTLTGDTPATRRLIWRTDTRARRRLEDEIFGKRILFTNRNDWPVVDVVAAYRTQPDVEGSFRQMKDPHVVSFSPMHHWTEQKIRVHAFYCVLALQIAHLMRREAHHAGLNLSVRGLLADLAGIQETVLLYQADRGRPRARRMLTDMNPTQQRLYNLFDLDRHAPRR